MAVVAGTIGCLSVRVGNREVHFSNPDKIFFPPLGLTKGDLLRYYLDLAPYVLNHIRRRFQAPNANAERWVGSVRRECLDRLLIFSFGQLERVRVYARHHNQHRPHRALELRPPNADIGATPRTRAALPPAHIRRRDLLGGRLHEYEAAA